MQQASNTSGRISVSATGNILPPAAPAPRFVINLCASTTPVGLVQPSHAGLKRFTFFVSRRLEEGRERFRLHMGYFESQEEAEKILDLVRDVYPAAWAGAAPGIKLRARAAASGAAATAPAETAPIAAAPVPTAPIPTATVVKLELVPDLPRAIPAPIPEFDAASDGAARSLSEVRATIDALG
ncbi:MAG: hypothetical protein KGL25_07920, partial [Gammaproteobacteria bacterium]|nr:hypothetical protein [Gammaproteobacteria bacterium]